MDGDDFVDFYEVLGVPPNATAEQIHAAYLKWTKLFHPDANRSDDPNRPPVDPALQVLVNKANEVLKDPAKRAAYDRIFHERKTRSGRGRGRDVPPRQPPPPPPRNDPPRRPRDVPPEERVVDPPSPRQGTATSGHSFFRTAALVVGAIGAGGIVLAAAVTSLKRPTTEAEVVSAADRKALKEEREIAQAKREAERQVAEAELAAAKEEASRLKQAEEAKRRQQAALATVKLKAILLEGEKALALVKGLEAEIDVWETGVKSLLADDRGRALSSDEVNVRAFQELWSAARPQRSDAQAISERIKIALRPVQEELAKTESFYVPEDSVLEMLKAEGSAVEKQTAALKLPRQQIESLLAVAERASQKGTLTLQQAIDQLRSKELEAKNRLLAEVDKEAKAKIAAAEAAKRRQEGVDTVRVIEAQTTAGKLRADEAVEHERLLKKAKSPEIQRLLSFFFTPGNLQADMSQTVEKVPHSYSKLLASGCLEQSPKGLTSLYQLFINNREKVRPKWPGNTSAFFLDQSEERKQLLIKIQDALVELGPVLVELKMLEP